jgi:hypothetical protein
MVCETAFLADGFVRLPKFVEGHEIGALAAALE